MKEQDDWVIKSASYQNVNYKKNQPTSYEDLIDIIFERHTA